MMHIAMSLKPLIGVRDNVNYAGMVSGRCRRYGQQLNHAVIFWMGRSGVHAFDFTIDTNFEQGKDVRVIVRNGRAYLYDK